MTQPTPPAPPVPVPDPAPAPAASGDPPRWLAVAAGGLPEQNQVSIEQDLGLAREVLGPGGRVLFGAGPGAPVVQVLREGPAEDGLRLRLAELFAPRGGRDARYREPAVQVDGPADAPRFWAELDHALHGDGPSLLLYIGGHGDRGEQPRQNTVGLWAQTSFTVGELAARLDEARGGPMVRVVATTCYSGGLGELAFAGGDARAGVPETRRCGLFAAPWDLEAAGCDPDPERARQESYGIHFLNALRSRGRDGARLAADEVDFDGDGQISLLDAHTWVRVVSRTADVPTTTSERWLEIMAPVTGPSAAVHLPHEDAVVRRLATQLGLAGHEERARSELAARERELEGLDDLLGQARTREDAAYRALAGEILARWPVLDDPWHPDWAATFDAARDAIEAHLAGSGAHAEYMDAREAVDELTHRVAGLRREAAPYERLVRARDTLVRAARLRARGGRSWTMFEALRECESSPP